MSVFKFKQRAVKQAGNIIVQVLMVTAAMGISFYFLTDYIIGQRQQVAKTRNLVNLRFTLSSAMDYVIFGVRQKYCFSNDGMLLNDAGKNCTLRHDGNIERLIMSQEQENFIRELIASGKDVGTSHPETIRLSEINRYIHVNAVSTNHPLFPILQSLKTVKGTTGEPVKIEGIKVHIKRNDNIFLPRAGHEVYATITVSLHSNENSPPVHVGSNELVLKSQIVVYPRELGSFALIVPNDLHMDTAWNAQLGRGDVSLHLFNSKSLLGNSSGLVFQSPVFVNRNIHIAKNSAAAEDSGPYSPVTFADRVYMGNGWVLSNNEGYSPRTAGGLSDRYWADVNTFGGFLKGIENDGGLDAGLQYFAKILTGTNSSEAMDLMNRCIELTKHQSSRDYLYQSRLGARRLSQSYDTTEYQLSLSNGNYFNSQLDALKKNISQWGKGKVSVTSSSGAVVKIRLDLADGADPNGRWAEAQLSDSGKVVFTAEVGSPQFKKTLQNEVDEARTQVAQLEDDVDGLNKDLKKARKKVRTLERELDEEESKPVRPQSEDPDEKPPSPPPEGWQDPDKISSLKSAIKKQQNIVNDIETRASNQETSLTDANKNLNDKKKALADFDSFVANPPRIEVSVSPIRQLFWKARNKLSLKITIINPEGLIDYKGTRVAPVIGILGYDGTYFKSNPIMAPSNGNLVGYLNFFYGPDGSLQSPSAISRTPASTAEDPTEDSYDWDTLAKKCEESRNSLSSQSFGGVGWATSFAAGTRGSWNFAGGTAGKDPGIDVLELKNITRSNAVFLVRSIVGRCVIDSSSDFITGFFACDELEIKPRSKPLRLIGTFIVGKLSLAPEAILSGITWSSVYHPQATRELRAAGILHSQSGAPCDSFSEPIWHPIPSIQKVADRMSCNAISLRAKANPFQWTAVDPDCGILPGASNTTCKKRLIRFYVVEQSREGGI